MTAVPTDARFTAAQSAKLAEIEAAPAAPESYRPLPGEVEMHRAMNATPEQIAALQAAAAVVGDRDKRGIWLR